MSKQKETTLTWLLIGFGLLITPMTAVFLLKIERLVEQNDAYKKQVTKLDGLCDSVKGHACRLIIEKSSTAEITQMAWNYSSEISSCVGASTTNLDNAIVRGTDVQIRTTFAQLFDCGSSLGSDWRETPPP